MALEIELRERPPAPIQLPPLVNQTGDAPALAEWAASGLRVDGEAWGNATPADLDRLRKLPLTCGRQTGQMGEWFDIRSSGTTSETVWLGHTGWIHGIGRGWAKGILRVEGPSGDYAAERMSGGRLLIAGSAGHWLAAHATGGTVEVQGDCGMAAAASLPGQRRGINGCVVIIHGSAGPGLGRRMRRGTVVVGGTTIDPGWEMLAGTLVLNGEVQGNIGAGMKRGTIICRHRPSSRQTVEWSSGPISEPLVWRLLHDHLSLAGIVNLLPEKDARFSTWHSGLDRDARGEIWAVATP